MKAILCGDKRLLWKVDVKHIKVCKYDEIAVKTMYPKLLERAELKPYFPDKYPKGRQCEKEYFWNVCATIFPEEVQNLILNANK